MSYYPKHAEIDDLTEKPSYVELYDLLKKTEKERDELKQEVQKLRRALGYAALP